MSRSSRIGQADEHGGRQQWSATTKKPGPPLILCVIVLVVGTVIGIWGLAVGISRAVNDINGPSVNTPAVIHTHLSSGAWRVYVETGDDSTITGTVPNIVTAHGVVVIGPDGTRIPTESSPGTPRSALVTSATRPRLASPPPPPASTS